ncbi:MAG: endonuclease MutS2 [Firmicutes bacterium]|nr:endonuclease MutS2 [Bacillota bacterium]
MISQKTLKTLEFDKILSLVSEYAVSQLGKDAIVSTRPTTDIFTANKLLDYTEEYYLAINKYNASNILSFDDISIALQRSSIGAILQISELLSIAKQIRAIRIIKKDILSCGEGVFLLKEIVNQATIYSTIENSIGDAIANEAELKDGASSELRDIRRKITSTDARLKEKLSSYTKKGSKFLQDNIVTVRNGRFVLPVKSEFRGEVHGIVHDRSDSGATVFIEPMAVVELNNELKSLQIAEQKEIEKILKILSSLVSTASENLKNNQEILVLLDIISAKMHFSVSFNASKPILNSFGAVNIKKGRHPLIDKSTVVPVDLSFGDQFPLLLITGPNTGGKTVCLKIAGLFSLMATSGFFIPAQEESEIAVFENVFCDIGDEQSIQHSLSTFSSHILNLSDITSKVTENSLILLDELGSGTDPLEGSAIAFGIIKHLEKRNAKGVITTHYSNLKQYATASDKIQNACMRFCEKSLKPTYQIVIGVAGASHALNIAESLGLDKDILRIAKESLNKDEQKFEQALIKAQDAKAEAIEERDRAKAERMRIEEELIAVEQERKKLIEQHRKLSENARLEVRRIIGNSVDKAEELIEEIVALKEKADEQSILLAKKKRRELENLAFIEELEVERTKPSTPLVVDDIKVGDNLYCEPLDSLAIVVALPNKRGEVQVRVGNALTNVHFSKLFVQQQILTSKNIASKNTSQVIQNNKHKPSSVTFNYEPLPPQTVPKELKVLGLTVSEAIQQIESFIMYDRTSNLQLRIVHGKGTGALGKGIQAYLKSLKRTKSIRYGRYGEGETGVTIVELNSEK